jgi:hypothetical protein
MPKNKNKKVETTSSNWDETVRAAENYAAQTPAQEKGEFTAGELGLPDDDEDGQRDGRGPLQQEGEGNRQNDQLAELEQDIDAKADLERRR